MCVSVCERSFPKNNLRDSSATMCASDGEALRACRPSNTFFLLCYFLKTINKASETARQSSTNTHVCMHTENLLERRGSACFRSKLDAISLKLIHRVPLLEWSHGVEISTLTHTQMHKEQTYAAVSVCIPVRKCAFALVKESSSVCEDRQLRESVWLPTPAEYGLLLTCEGMTERMEGGG